MVDCSEIASERPTPYTQTRTHARTFPHAVLPRRIRGHLHVLLFLLLVYVFLPAASSFSSSSSPPPSRRFHSRRRRPWPDPPPPRSFSLLPLLLAGAPSYYRLHSHRSGLSQTLYSCSTRPSIATTATRSLYCEKMSQDENIVSKRRSVPPIRSSQNRGGESRANLHVCPSPVERPEKDTFSPKPQRRVKKDRNALDGFRAKQKPQEAAPSQRDTPRRNKATNLVCSSAEIPLDGLSSASRDYCIDRSA